MTLQIRNPHSVLAALETRPQDLLQIVVPPGHDRDGASGADAWARVVSAARSHKVQVTQAAPAREQAPGRERDRGRRGTEHRPAKGGPGDEGGRLGAAHAVVREREGISAEELFSGARDRAGGRGLWLALDCLQDPHNVGAIFRAAGFFGVQGILLTQERSAPLTGAVYDVASGGVEYVPFALQTSLQRAFEIAKEAGLWILGSSERARDELGSIQRDRPWLLVLGNEEKGMRRLTEESCDVVCKIAPRGKVGSLNVSVAAGILIASLSAPPS